MLKIYLIKWSVDDGYTWSKDVSQFWIDRDAAQKYADYMNKNCAGELTIYDVIEVPLAK